MRHRTIRLGWTALALVLAASALRADEGMWTFDNLPARQMKEKYGFTPDQAWLDHVRLSAVRFPGGSGSFISADGLVLTNHHVGHDWIERLGDKAHDYVEQGFVAPTRAREIRAPGLVLYTLMATRDVTAEVEKSVAPGLDEKAASEARRASLAALAKAEETRTGLTCEPVTLYQGGELWIYSYRKHTDVRLVMAPEYGVAAFGKDWDNFSFPRHDLDFSLWRVYENGKPYHPAHHLAWSAKGVRLGDMTFTVGHPGRTSRLETLAQMESRRDVMNPLRLRTMERTLKLLHAYAAKGGEGARQLSSTLMGLENGYKVITGETAGLHNQAAMTRLAKAEEALKAKVAADPALQASTGQSWDRIRQAMERQRAMAQEGAIVGAASSALLQDALFLDRLAQPADGPADRALHALRERFETRPPMDLVREGQLLVQHYRDALADLGAGHPYVQALLEGRTPEAAAKALVAGTKLADPAFRRSALDQGAPFISASTDPALVLARSLSPLVAKVRQEREAIQAIVAEHGARIAKARFQVYGRTTYPDATFTLRLSYGAVETYRGAGTLVQPFTTFGGLYDRADAWGPVAEGGSWALPARWKAARPRLDLSTPFDFITTNDIIGGNSGSPVVDRKGELVGLAFDGNIESLSGQYFFEPDSNRCLAVDGRAIVEALGKVYGAPALVAEIRGKAAK